MCQEKKEVEDLSSMKLVLVHRCDDSMTTIKKSTERPITVTRNNTNHRRINRTTITRKQNGKKSNCMNISNDKQTKSHARRLEHG